MTIETCKVCGASGDGGAGCFTSDEDVCANCYARTPPELRRIGRYWVIVPVAAPEDHYAAGYNGNAFVSESVAREEIPLLARALGTSPNAWTVKEVANVDR